jgi:hypothetical protein
MRFTEQVLTDLLEQRHKEDVFIPQCKNGSSWTPKGVLLRLDAWVLKKTWSPVTTIGYEIKVNRQDFLKDEKWVNALLYCHQFYFVCPPKLISEKEMPKEVGLMWASANGSQLFIKRKAPRRQIQLPVELPLYILMSRSQIVASTYMKGKEGAEFWRAWLAEKDEHQKLALKVGHRIREIVRRHETDVHQMQEKMRAYDEIDARLKQMGIDLRQQTVWDAYHKIDEMGGRDLHMKVERLIGELTRFGNQLNAAMPTKVQRVVKQASAKIKIRLPHKAK